MLIKVKQAIDYAAILDVQQIIQSLHSVLSCCCFCCSLLGLGQQPGNSDGSFRESHSGETALSGGGQPHQQDNRAGQSAGERTGGEHSSSKVVY